LKDKGFRNSTIKTKLKIVKTLSKKTNLWDSKIVEECIAEALKIWEVEPGVRP
jgi:hypothetical protein